jgi:P-type Cu2+ transporter
MDHSHHSQHHHPQPGEKAKSLANATEAHLAGKTLHAHDQAMPPEHAGHHGEPGHDHHAMMIGDFKKRFWVSLLLSLPVILISPMVQHILGYSLQVPYQM